MFRELGLLGLLRAFHGFEGVLRDFRRRYRRQFQLPTACGAGPRGICRAWPIPPRLPSPPVAAALIRSEARR
jgi:hypothetical protein